MLLRSYSENRNKKFQIQGGAISPAPPVSATEDCISLRHFKADLRKAMHKTFLISVTNFGLKLYMPEHLKGSDWLCMVVELSMQCCGKLLSDSFETY